MKKLYIAPILTMVISGMSFFCPESGVAGIDLPFSTTFNCPAWDGSQGPNIPPACGSMSPLNNGVGPGGLTYSSISSASNDPGGGGGNGYRDWVTDSQNLESGGLSISFNQPQTEVWVRYRARYQAGFNWYKLGYQKFFYFHATGGTFGLLELIGDRFRMLIGGSYARFSAGPGGQFPVGTGWNYINGGSKGDGLFHEYQTHVKIASAAGNDGVWDMWVDGVQVAHAADEIWTTPFAYLELMVNQSCPYNGTEPVTSLTCNQAQPTPNPGTAYIDIDDIAFSNTGYIGPAGAPPAAAPPAAPRGLTVK